MAKVMHGQYGLLLHAPSITACGIAWGLHCKQNSIYIYKQILFFVLFFLSTCTYNVYLNVILVLCHIM